MLPMRRGWGSCWVRFQLTGRSASQRIQEPKGCWRFGERCAIRDSRPPGERPREPVDLIDDDNVDPACLDIGKQTLQGWSPACRANEKGIAPTSSGKAPISCDQAFGVAGDRRVLLTLTIVVD
jgi:hypothetical protein